MKNFRKVKNLCLLIVSIMILQLAMPMSFAGAEPMAGEEQSIGNLGEYGEITSGAAINAEGFGFGILSEGKKLENVFRNVSLTVDGKKLVDGEAIEIKDNTVVVLRYDWEIVDGLDAKSGDWAEIIVPNAFISLQSFENEDIKLSDSSIVGKYSLIGNKIKFVFDEHIEETSVREGFVEFGFEFELTEFDENIVQEIPFNTTETSDFTIVRKPKEEAASIDKLGVPDKKLNPSKIDWSIDVVNTEDYDIDAAVVEDDIPEGLKLDPASIKVYGLTIGYNGNTPGTTEIDTGFTIDIKTDNSLKITFGELDKYSGYRIDYKTDIVDKTKVSFTNNARLSYTGSISGTPNLTAKSTVDKLTWSNPIEKDGKKINVDVIEWTIDVNKAGDTIGNAIVEEVLPGGLSVDKATIEIFKLNGESWVKDDAKTAAAETNGFPITLGPLSSADAYRIKFRTNVDYSKVNGGIHQISNSFKNKTVLKDDSNIIGEAEKPVTITRNPILEKNGVPKNDYSDKTITWTVHVNRANHPIDDANIVDAIPAGLKVLEPITITKRVKGNNVDTPVTLDASDISIAQPAASAGDAKGSLTIDLGSIGTDYYKIVYKTEILDFSEAIKFTNKVGLTGVGVGLGIEKEADAKPKDNSYLKEYVGIDYNAKTISWKIIVDPIKDPIKTLTITDTFPNKGLILLDDENFIVKKGTETFVRGTHYTLTPNTGGYKDGFTLVFLPAALPLNAKTEITFNTSYDPEKGVDANTDNSTENGMNYKNKATFRGTTVHDKTINADSEANKQVLTESWNSGKKIGRRVNIDGSTVTPGWVSGKERIIEWEVYINYLKQDLGSGISVKDDINYDGIINESSIVVKKYNVASNGETSLGSDLDSSNYTITMDTDQKGFTLSFNGEVNERYVIIYNTTVPDISSKTYTNTATTSGNTIGSGIYEGTVSYSKYNDYLTKSSLGISGNRVYTDDEIKWEVTINENLSKIKNAKVIDTISPGLEYLNNSLEVYRLVGTEEVLVDSSKYSYNKTGDSDTGTVITIEFNDTIDSKYVIRYKTVVVEENGNVNNGVAFSGVGFTTETVTTKNLEARKFTNIGGVPDTNKGKIVINKIDGETDLNVDAEFELYYYLNGREQVFGTYTTENGQLEIVNLTLGRTYYLRETKAPEGYLGLSADKEIQVNNNTPINLEIENYKIKGNIEFIKIGEDNDIGGLAGVKFGLYELSDTSFNSPVDTAISGTSGLVKFNDVPYGTYKLKEISVPVNYRLSDKVYDVGITEDGVKVKPTYNSITIDEIANEKIRGNIEFNKVNHNNQPLSGAIFGIYKSTDTGFENLITTATSISSGLVKFENVEYGQYVIKENLAPEGYIPSDIKLNVTISEHGNTVNASSESIRNEIMKGDIEIIKLGENKEPLKGAKFNVTNRTNFNEEYTSDEHGRIELNNLEYGVYTIAEIEPPEGYNLSETGIDSVDISFDGVQRRVEFTNTKIRGSIEFTKYGENNDPLEGATFTLYHKNDVNFEEPVASAISNAEGKVLFDEVEYGSYVIRETKASKGYILSDETLEATISEEGVKVIANPESISNTKIRGSLQILKVDRRNERPLANAIFVLYNSNMEKIEEITTGEDGKVVFENLEYGRYFYEETKAPSRYYRDSTVYEINIPEEENEILLNGFIIEKVVENKRRPTGGEESETPEEPEEPETPKEPEEPEVPDTPEEPEIPEEPDTPEEPEKPVIDLNKGLGNILIKKLDLDSNPLEGAEFTLYDQSGTAIKTITSDVNGTVLFSNLPLGIYSVMEIKAPEGYELINDRILVDLKEAKTLKYNFRNAPEGIVLEDPEVPLGWEPIEEPTETELPYTGSFGTFDLILVGVELMLIGLWMLLKKRYVSKQ